MVSLLAEAQSLPIFLGSGFPDPDFRDRMDRRVDRDFEYGRGGNGGQDEECEKEDFSAHGTF